MTSQDIYKLGVELGIKHDPRGRDRVNTYLERTRKKYDKLDAKSKEFFDTEKLTNPYADTRVLHDNNREIKKVLMGVDMEGPELLLAKQMGDIDLVIAHHPEGKAYADLHSVMDLQAEMYHNYGVPINIAEKLTTKRLSEVSRSVSGANHNRGVDFARILDINYMCMHTPCDNIGADLLQQKIDFSRPEYVEDVLELLHDIHEFNEARKLNAGPTLFAGSADNRCGKVVVSEYTGGTSGAKELYKYLSMAGIGTIISMHMGEAHRKLAEEHHMNVIVAGHMASDSLGINVFLDKLVKQGVEVEACSGIIRKK